MRRPNPERRRRFTTHACFTAGVIVLSIAGVRSLAAPDPVSSGDSALVPVVDLRILVGRHPIWAGHFFRYTVYDSTIVEARFNSMGGEVIQVLRLGMQPPGQHTIPWNGTLEEGAVMFEGKYQLELFFGEEYAAKIWFLSQRITPASQ